MESHVGFQEVEEKGKKIQSKVDTPGKMRNDQADGYCYPVTFPILGFKYLLMFAHILNNLWSTYSSVLEHISLIFIFLGWNMFETGQPSLSQQNKILQDF